MELSPISAAVVVSEKLKNRLPAFSNAIAHAGLTSIVGQELRKIRRKTPAKEVNTLFDSYELPSVLSFYNEVGELTRKSIDKITCRELEFAMRNAEARQKSKAKLVELQKLHSSISQVSTQPDMLVVEALRMTTTTSSS
ncbi:MAG: hypothetical protein ACWA6X_09890 [Bauldia sp.]